MFRNYDPGQGQLPMHLAELVAEDHVAIDGAKLKANASKYKNLSKERLEANIPKLQEEVHRLLQRAVEADQADDQEFGEQDGNSLPDELKDKQARRARLEEALAKLKAQQENGERSKRTDPEKHSINPTDPDSRIMSGATGAASKRTTGKWRQPRRA